MGEKKYNQLVCQSLSILGYIGCLDSMVKFSGTVWAFVKHMGGGKSTKVEFTSWNLINPTNQDSMFA